MPGKVNALVITGYGTNCEVECAHAATLAGADAVTVIHFSDLVSGESSLDSCNFLLFPGGFLDGDDLGAAQAASIRWQHAVDEKETPLLEQLSSLLARGGIILGICNGFQLLVKLGLLPGFDGKYFSRSVSLMHNASGRYEDRWCTLTANPQSPCVFTRDIGCIDLPVRHGEGRLVTENDAVLERLEKENLVALRYADPASKAPTQEYPHNPNGSPNAIAGLCDPTGRVFGLMPHPEAFNHPTNHPDWTRGGRPQTGIVLLANGVRYLRERSDE